MRGKLGQVGCVLFLVAPATGQVTTRISVDSRGAQGNGFSEGSLLSADGRYVLFDSHATNLVAGDTNGHGDLFLRDRQLGTTERVSVGRGGVQGNDDSGEYGFSLTPDGRYVTFLSWASNLVAGDTNYYPDDFVRDRRLGTTERVSVGSHDVQGNGYCYGTAISDDGRYVAFASESTNLVPGDTNGKADIFVRDRSLGTTELVSVDSSGSQGDGNCDFPCISADGRFVVFVSEASNLVSGDTNGMRDVFVRDRRLGTTERVSVSSSGTEGDYGADSPSISPDGRFVAFESAASNLVPRDTNGTYDVFVRDRLLGTTERVSVAWNGSEGEDVFGSHLPSISADGRYVAFESYDPSLVVGDTNGVLDVFLRDRRLETTERLSLGSNDVQGRQESFFSSISADGRFVAFTSFASDLVPGDTNENPDIFVRDVRPTGFTSSCEPALAGVIGCPCVNPPTGGGRGCDNSAATGGATMSATGVAYLSMDSLAFSTSGETPSASSVLLQGTSAHDSGVVYGQGVRCVGGRLRRLFTKTASVGSVTAPDFAAGDPTISARSAARGVPISAGESRWYLVFYRDPIVLGGCPPASTFNASQTGQVVWSP